MSFQPQFFGAPRQDQEQLLAENRALRLQIAKFEAAKSQRQPPVEEVPRSQEDLFRTLADCAPVMIWLAGTDGYSYYFNRPWLNFTGRTLAQEVGQGWMDGVHPEDVDSCVKTYRAAFESLESFRMEYRLRRSDGEYCWVLNTGTARFLPDGRFVGFVGSCIDITERKQVEQEREILLEQEQRTRIEAQEANRIKNEFLATLSHELRTPLNAIIGFSQLLKRGRLDPIGAQRAIEAIERNGKLQLGLVEDLLDVSRIINGKLHLEMYPLDLIVVVEAALESLHPTAQIKNISLEAILDPNCGPVLGNSSRLQQVVWNLLSNAIKFTPRGGLVKICLTQSTSEAILTVADTGQGIAPDFLPFIFERFRQADSSINRSFGGLGLGLAIVRNLVELHGGTIQANSSGKGHGATFTVWLPLLAPHSAFLRGTLGRPQVIPYQDAGS